MKIELRLDITKSLPNYCQVTGKNFLCFSWYCVSDTPFRSERPTITLLPCKDDDIDLPFDLDNYKHPGWEVNFTTSKRKIDLVRRKIVIKSDNAKFSFNALPFENPDVSEENSLIEKLKDCGWTFQ